MQRYSLYGWEFNGLECTVTAHPIVESLWDVEIIDAACGFAVGDSATISRWNGESWSKERMDVGSVETPDRDYILLYLGSAIVPVVVAGVITFLTARMKQKKEK